MCRKVILGAVLLHLVIGVGHGDSYAQPGVESELRITIRNSAEASLHGIIAEIAEAPGWLTFESTIDTVTDCLLPGEASVAVFRLRSRENDPSECEIAVNVATTEGRWLRRFPIFTHTSTSFGHPATCEVYEPEPNPFSASVSIRFSLREKCEATLSIYDASGKFIRTLAAGTHPAGVHMCQWDGKDSRDRDVANGTYFLKVVTGEYARTKKIVVIR